MAPLAPDLRRNLDKAISSTDTGARSLAEAAAQAALDRLGVEEKDAPAALSREQRDLRSALRERAKALGGGVRTLGIPLLVEEIAYEQWHRMLFARFLAENDLLLHPEGAPVSLADVKQEAAESGERDPWVLAARYAAAMLPGIFRADDPANRVSFAPEDRTRLESVLERLPAALFTSDDALGWVYQFWQSQRKDEVNMRGDKIGGADLPPVTQLFTEHYMVRFLLENSLGAWWAGRHPDSPLVLEWEYLRFRDDGTPAAGTFEGWPTRSSEVTVMDPCCGSGHFLVAAADMLRKMRMEEEGLTPAQAAVTVIADNLFGLELDARCLQLAAFNLALDAWKVGGYQPLPIPNIACSGIAIKGQRDDWHRLAGDDDRMRNALDRLYDLFQDAPELGSLIDPRSAAGKGLWRVDTDELLTKLDRALARETTTDPAAAVFGAAALGTARAARLLAGHYRLVATNPPFLMRRRQGPTAQLYADAHTPDARADLATLMLERGGRLSDGSVAFVSPSAWLSLGIYQSFRRRWLATRQLHLIARLGTGAFDTISGEIVNVALLVSGTGTPSNGSITVLLDSAGTTNKRASLRNADLIITQQGRHLDRPDARVVFASTSPGRPMGSFATTYWGSKTGDDGRFKRQFWEPARLPSGWMFCQTSFSSSRLVGGCLSIVDVRGANRTDGAQITAEKIWGSDGFLVKLMQDLPATLYQGELFDQNVAAVIPKGPAHALPLWQFLGSGSFHTAVRALDTSLKVTGGTLEAVPFDLDHWQKVAAEQYPNGLPEPHSDDPTQWLFKGNVVGSEAPLQVAVARLLGYRWPNQEPDSLDELTDADGLVPLPAVGGERSAADRLRSLLARAYGDAWSPVLQQRLVAEAGSSGVTLESWLRDYFFAQHVKLFDNRPFIWHVWDGRKDGFSLLCNYHRLDRAALEKVTYTLLGDWIERQKAAGAEAGAEARLAAALGLQDKLRHIIEGEAPLDIYVRWKALGEQPIGWEPDLDDGVRLNIRPLVTAGVLRAKVNVKWDKDRGKDPDGSERINDLHPTLAEKRAARSATKGR